MSTCTALPKSNCATKFLHSVKNIYIIYAFATPQSSPPTVWRMDVCMQMSTAGIKSSTEEKESVQRSSIHRLMFRSRWRHDGVCTEKIVLLRHLCVSCVRRWRPFLASYPSLALFSFFVVKAFTWLNYGAKKWENSSARPLVWVWANLAEARQWEACQGKNK